MAYVNVIQFEIFNLDIYLLKKTLVFNIQFLAHKDHDQSLKFIMIMLPGEEKSKYYLFRIFVRGRHIHSKDSQSRKKKSC